MAIGDNIKSARKALKMSQDELADATGANRVTISHYENGVYLPSVPALQRLADALGTTPAALTGEAVNVDIPQTKEAQEMSSAMDKLKKEQRVQALEMMKVMFPKAFKG